MKAEEILSPKQIAMQAITGSFQTNGEGYDSKIDLENHTINKIQDYAEAYHQSKLQALKQRLDDYKAHPIVKRRNGEEFKLYGFISIQEAKRIITNLEDNGH